jgi:hypothetical protein
MPEVETVPPLAVHATDESAAPDTLAVNCCVPARRREVAIGVIEMETGAITVTVALADLELSATLVAVTE